MLIINNSLPIYCHFYIIAAYSELHLRTRTMRMYSSQADETARGYWTWGQTVQTASHKTHVSDSWGGEGSELLRRNKFKLTLKPRGL